MILRRFGETVQSVELDFNSKALTEIGFRRDRQFSLPFDEFEAGYTSVETHDLRGEAEGDVQDHVEQEMLDDLEARVKAIVEGLGDGEVVYVESEQGMDYPKTRSRTKNVVVEGENRLYFYASIDPPLRLGVYRKN